MTDHMKSPDFVNGLPIGSGSWWVFPLLTTMVGAAFSPALGNGWVNLDDHENFTNNPDFRGFSWGGFYWAWRTYQLGVYQPLAWLLLEGQYSIWGISPRGYHLTSLLLHLSNTLVLYGLATAMLSRSCLGRSVEGLQSIRVATVLAVSLFAVHPLRVEVVAWTSCQPYLPCVFFSLLTVYAYVMISYMKFDRGKIWMFGIWLLFLAALLSKAAAVSIPIVLLILDIYPLRRFEGKENRLAVLIEKLPFVMLSVVFSVLAIRAKKSNQSLELLHYDNMVQIYESACGTIMFYLRKTILPVGLTAFYPLPEGSNFSEHHFIVSSVIVTIASAFLLLMRRRLPGLFAAWACYLVMLVPNLGLVRISWQYAADRYSYAAMTVWVVPMSYLMASLCIGGRPRRSANAILILAIAAIIGLIGLSRHQCQTWRNSIALWTQALDHGAGDECSHSMPVFAGLCKAIITELRPGEALEELNRICKYQETIVKHHPNGPVYRSDLAATLNNLSISLMSMERPDEAVAMSRLAVAHELIALDQSKGPSNHAGVLYNHRLTLAQALLRAGRAHDAVDLLLECADSCPDDPFLLLKVARGLAFCISFPDSPDQAKRLRCADRAMDLLRRSVYLGFNDFSSIINDEALTTLRDREDFKALVKDPGADIPESQISP